MRFSQLFISPTERRLRAGWRLVVQSLLSVALSIVLSFVWLLGAGPLEGVLGELDGEAALGVSVAVSAAACTLSIYLARRLVDRRSFCSLGLAWDRWAWRDLAFGLGLTGLMMGLIYAAEWALGWLRFEGFAWQTGAAADLWVAVPGSLVVFILVGWQEELQDRGYRLRNLAEGLNPTWGVVLSSAVFAAAHWSNPSFSWMAMLGLFGAGVWFAYAVLRTGQLWLPIGLHIGWNFFEGPVFGFPVSGLTMPGIIRQSAQGPQLLTGGAFGPEAGLVLFPALIVSAVAIRAYTRGRPKRGPTGTAIP